MKQLILFLTTLTMISGTIRAAQTSTLSGRITNQQGQAVEFATVVVHKDNVQIAGMVTNNRGCFEFKIPVGNYTLSVQYLGCHSVDRPLEMRQDNDLGDIILTNSTTQIEDVVVKASFIRREADRLIVDVANSPAAIGKNSIELLETTPGVWIDGEKISINGKTGSKVFINDRELKYTPAQLITYLRALKASEIQKIEVVPLAGADYDASGGSGVIRITLRKLRTNGVEGSVSLDSQQSSLTHLYTPSGDLRIHIERLDLYTNGWGSLGTHIFRSNEQTINTVSNSQLYANSQINNRNYDGGGTVGAVFEINKRNSIGGEFSIFNTNDPTLNNTSTDLISDASTHTDSHFSSSPLSQNYAATFNYIHRLDTLGSTFKVLADYAHRSTQIDNDNISRISGSEITDSLYRDNTTSTHSVAALTLALEKHLSSRWVFKSGSKYTRIAMNNDIQHEYLKNQTWLPNAHQSFRQNHVEHIAAAYGIVSATLGRWSAVAGLRGEYTHTTGKGGPSRNYFSLFPNANLSYSLTKDGTYSLIAQYARTIERPLFSQMTPQRMQISDYTYQIGNINLTPAYTQELSMTLVLASKYTFSGSLSIRTGEIEQTVLSDPSDPNLLYLTWINYERMQSYYFSATLPFQLTKWWLITANLYYSGAQQRVDAHTSPTSHNAFMGQLSTTFTLPRKFYIDCNYTGMTALHFGTISTNPQHRLQASIKKRFGEQWTLWLGVDNLLDQGQEIFALGEGFQRKVNLTQPWTNRTYKLGASFNFKSGKKFSHKSVEAGAASDKGRM